MLVAFLADQHLGFFKLNYLNQYGSTLILFFPVFNVVLVLDLPGMKVFPVVI